MTTLNVPDGPQPDNRLPAGRGLDSRLPGSDVAGPDIPETGTASGPLAVRRASTARVGLLGQPPVTGPVTGAQTWPVGFSPTGDVLPTSLTEVLTRGSQAVRSAKKVEELRRKRAGAIATHVDQQIADFLAICTAENLAPPLALRVIRDHPLLFARGAHRGHPRPDTPESTTAPGGHAGQSSGSADAKDRRQHRRLSPRTWPVLYWRNEMFPYTGRSLHLFIDPAGQTFEGREDPGPLHALGREIRAWPVDVHEVVGSMAEVDARRCAHQLVYGMAHLLWRAGIGL